MPRKKRRPSNIEIPRIAGEKWEVGYRLLANATDQSPELAPTFLFVAQADGPGGIVFRRPIVVGDAMISLANAIEQAMQDPEFGHPRQPEIICVSTQTEADELYDALAAAGIQVEVVTQLTMIDKLMIQMSPMLGGMTTDYRTRTHQVGESLSNEGLRQVFQMAQQFYRHTPWKIYNDSELFQFTIQSNSRTDKTFYGVILGQMGAEFGLALYASLDDLALSYDLEKDTADALPAACSSGDRDESEPRHANDMAAHFSATCYLSLTFTAPNDTPHLIVEEAKSLDLPLATPSAYPVILRLRQGQMNLATASELGDICTAIRAILAWDNFIKSLDDEVDLDDDDTLLEALPAIEGLLPSLNVEVDLIDNPYMLDDEFDDIFTDIDISELATDIMLDTLTNAVSESAAKPSQLQQARPLTNSEDAKVFTLDVYLVSEPFNDSYEDTKISRQIHLLGHHTLHDLHLAISAAFDRKEEYVYEFNLGISPQDRSQLHFYQEEWSDKDRRDFGDPKTTHLSDLNLTLEKRFSYVFDTKDQWKHIISVNHISTGADKGPYPKFGKRVGSSPLQYLNFDEDDE